MVTIRLSQLRWHLKIDVVLKKMGVKIEIDGTYCPKVNSRWNTYGNYKLILWAWMMNEMTVMFSPAEISHNGIFTYAALETLAVVLVGMPLAYSEICLAQYTNCNIFTMWHFFPLFRNVGYGTLYLIFLKTLYVLVLTSWYLVYTFYAALEVPPWNSCDDYDDAKCMVKRVNVTIFQHCIEAHFLFGEDCGMKTASNCFFEREIGGNCTAKIGLRCLIPWKTIVAVLTICASIYVLSIKQEKIIQVVVRLSAVYVCGVILVLFCVAMSTSGTWYSTKITVNWINYIQVNCYGTITRGFLSVGTGYGILVFLTRDVSFRSPAAMTAISTPLFALFVSFIFALIAFSGIKTMSYYHGEEEDVIEIGSSIFFPIFASMSEIMSYFDALPIWGFFWFSTVFCSLYINYWILYLFLKELLLHLDLANKYSKLSCMFMLIVLIICTLPFLCSDLTSMLTDATEIIQSLNCLFLSVSLYWIYGIQKHNVDIIFMIGIKTNYFLKIAWFLNPVFITIIIYARWTVMETYKFKNSYYIRSISLGCDMLLLYIILSIYGIIIVVGLIAQVFKFYSRGQLRALFSAKESWGPRDKVLYRSRKMFVPEIMTREFLYRQVRIRSYYKKQDPAYQTKAVSSEESSCSAVTTDQCINRFI